MNHPTLAVNQQGSIESLKYPLYRVQGYAYWIVFQDAVLMVREGWIFYWLRGQPDFQKNHSDAILMDKCDRTEVLDALNHEIGILQFLSQMI